MTIFQSSSSHFCFHFHFLLCVNILSSDHFHFIIFSVLRLFLNLIGFTFLHTFRTFSSLWDPLSSTTSTISSSTPAFARVTQKHRKSFIQVRARPPVEMSSSFFSSYVFISNLSFFSCISCIMLNI